MSAGAVSPRRDTVIGIAWGVVVVLIWAVWVVSTRAGVKTLLRSIDIAFIRYACASAVLVPLCWRQRMPWIARDLRTTILMVCGAGAPFLVVSITGMRFAPASHIASVMMGTMPFFVVMLAAIVLHERLRVTQWAGLLLLMAGIALFSRTDLAGENTGQWRGHLLFMLAAAMWALYTIAMRTAKVSALHAAGLVNGWSLVGLGVIYFSMARPDFAAIQWRDVGIQAITQTLSAVVGLFAYGESVRRLGPSRAAVLGALTPPVAALIAIPVLGELPTPATWGAIALVAAGVVCASLTRIPMPPLRLLPRAKAQD